MAPSGGAAGSAADRLRAARERATLRREASRQAVEQLRQRNRQESRTLAERAGVARRQRWPEQPGHGRPQEMHLFDADADTVPVEPPPQPPARPSLPAPPRQPGARRSPDDDWSQESWLH